MSQLAVLLDSIRTSRQKQLMVGAAENQRQRKLELQIPRLLLWEWLHLRGQSSVPKAALILMFYINNGPQTTICNEKGDTHSAKSLSSTELFSSQFSILCKIHTKQDSL